MSATQHSGSVLDDMSEVILPEGGYLVGLVEAYFDESYDGTNHGLLCVAGCVIEKKASRRLARKWNKVLQKNGLPFFHMVDCAHGNKHFAGMKEGRPDAIARQMIGLTKEHCALWFGVTLDMDEYSRRFPDKRFFGGPYNLCVYTVLRGIADWIEKTKYDGNVAYYFEAGHHSQRQANEIMDFVFKTSEFKHELRYAGHGFVEKAKAPQVQAADIFAWQLRKDLKSQAENRPRRKDFLSLMEVPHRVGRIDNLILNQLEKYWAGSSASIVEKMRSENLRVLS